jgi:hypothetical protein
MLSVDDIDLRQSDAPTPLPYLCKIRAKLRDRTIRRRLLAKRESASIVSNYAAPCHVYLSSTIAVSCISILNAASRSASSCTTPIPPTVHPSVPLAVSRHPRDLHNGELASRARRPRRRRLAFATRNDADDDVDDETTSEREIVVNSVCGPGERRPSARVSGPTRQH